MEAISIIVLALLSANKVVRDDVIASIGEWSSPEVTGQPPPPCDDFTLTPVGERRAALFGGDIGPELAVSDDLLIVELTQYKTVVSV